MPYYRLYRLAPNNKIIDAIEFIGADANAAKDEAVRIDHAAVIEIWCGKTVVARVDPQPKNASRCYNEG